MTIRFSPDASSTLAFCQAGLPEVEGVPGRSPEYGLAGAPVALLLPPC